MNYKIAVGVGFVICAALSFWQWGINAPVLSYGDTNKAYFKPAIAYPGQKIDLCFDDVTWHKICPSSLYTYIQPVKGHRIDFPIYNISTPASTGKVPPKCRLFIVPDTEEYGIAVLSGHAKSFCTLNTIITKLPDVKLEIVKK